MLKSLALLMVYALISLGGIMPFSLTSSAFNHEQRIPTQFTCDGADHSPPLAWANAPANTQSFVLIMDDPDAPGGTWVHWVLYNIPATAHSLTENIQTMPLGTEEGKNSWEHLYYNGPCPPPNSEHRYFFKLYALDAELELADGATKAEVEDAMHGHVLASVELIGKYQRPVK